MKLGDVREKDKIRKLSNAGELICPEKLYYSSQNVIQRHDYEV